MVRATASVTGRSPLRAFCTFLWESCLGEAATKSWLEKFPSVRRRSSVVVGIARGRVAPGSSAIHGFRRSAGCSLLEHERGDPRVPQLPFRADETRHPTLLGT